MVTCQTCNADLEDNAYCHECVEELHAEIERLKVTIFELREHIEELELEG